MNIHATIADMTIEEKVGQMFMLAFAGDQLDEARILMGEHLVGGALHQRRKCPKRRSRPPALQRPAVFRARHAPRHPPAAGR